MAVRATGTRIEIPQGDTGSLRFVADVALTEDDRALFTVAGPHGGVLLRRVLSPDDEGCAFELAFSYRETASIQPGCYEWSLRLIRDGRLDDKGRITSARDSHTAVLCGRLVVLPVAGGAR